MLFDVVDQLPQDTKLKRQFIRSLNERAKKLYDTYDLDRRLIFQGVSLRDGWVKDDKPWQDTSPFTVLEYSNQSLDVRQCILSNGTYEYLRPAVNIAGKLGISISGKLGISISGKLRISIPGKLGISIPGKLGINKVRIPEN